MMNIRLCHRRAQSVRRRNALRTTPDCRWPEPRHMQRSMMHLKKLNASSCSSPGDPSGQSHRIIWTPGLFTSLSELMVAYASMEPLSNLSFVIRLAPQAQHLQSCLPITVWSQTQGDRLERYVTSSCLWIT